MQLDARFLVNLGIFQLGWFACVLGGANGMPWLGTGTVAAALIIHLYMARSVRAEITLVAIVALIGTVWDSLIVTLGLMSYPSGTFAAGIAPHWIIAMWVLFATTLNVSMAWLRERAAAAALLGAIGGPLAYLTGYRLGGVDIASPWLALGAQSAGWALMMPLLMKLASAVNVGVGGRVAAVAGSPGSSADV